MNDSSNQIQHDIFVYLDEANLAGFWSNQLDLKFPWIYSSDKYIFVSGDIQSNSQKSSVKQKNLTRYFYSKKYKFIFSIFSNYPADASNTVKSEIPGAEQRGLLEYASLGFLYKTNQAKTTKTGY